MSPKILTITLAALIGTVQAAAANPVSLSVANFLNQNESAPTSTAYIKPKNPTQPFIQWLTNNGYCGEVNVIESGLNQGLWISQYNARLICGSGLQQVGPGNFCQDHQNVQDFNAQVLPQLPIAGDLPFASAPVCLANARLAAQVYPKEKQPAGMAGYENYMSWIKAQIIAGNQVGIAIIESGGNDPEIDHEVAVAMIGTNHSPVDPTYYDDDVLYFNDHTDSNYAFTFKSMANTREGANSENADVYSIVIPGNSVSTMVGGDGIHQNPTPIIAGNYAFAVSGPIDTQGVALPIVLHILSSSAPDGTPFTADPVAGFNFEETPATDCSNAQPEAMNMQIKATVSGLSMGAEYNLYEYDFNSISGEEGYTGLNIPTADFNANAAKATKTTHFTATADTFSQTIATSSAMTVAFRCVRADAP
jgi:hypothetical protein